MINGKAQPGAQVLDSHLGPIGTVTAPNGVFSLPGCHWLYGAGDEQGRIRGGYAVLCISGPMPAQAHHITLTPEGLRHFAEKFQAMATGIEEAAAREAAAALNKAAGK